MILLLPHGVSALKTTNHAHALESLRLELKWGNKFRKTLTSVFFHSFSLFDKCKIRHISPIT